MKKDEFQYFMYQEVRLVASEERGKIIGRAEFAASENTYLVRYKAGDGRQVESWWGESAIMKIP